MLQEAYVMDVEGGSSRVSASVRPSDPAAASWVDSPRYLRLADTLVVLTAVALPWSTTLTGALMLVWLAVIVPTIDWDELIRSLALPACALPLALFVLADVGVLWSDAPWEAGLQAINPVSKLLLLPFLFHHFRRSERAAWVFVGFLASSAVLMMSSWTMADLSSTRLRIGSAAILGEPTQGRTLQFTLCALGLLVPALLALAQRRLLMAATWFGLGLAFLAHDLFIVPARTLCLYLPILLLVLAGRHFSRRLASILVLSAALTGGVAWAAAPFLGKPIADLAARHRVYVSGGLAQGPGDWPPSVRAIGEAPLFGHGTGWIRRPFELQPDRQGARQTEIRPSAPSMMVGLQWGLVGLILLAAMWISHFRLFRSPDWMEWVGLTVVVQSVIGSLLSTSLLDVSEGWIYVLGVGVAGGVMLGRANAPDRVDGQRSGAIDGDQSGCLDPRST
ncbi:O-antigen ligase domain-containing protein [Bradyrhizobium aeschynomenes]|uniref:O-antigen ligase domain-containing protein n=1 Tax=Bradyrhizobium aeschynomenes TaxID=2734909 RepID=UPI00155311F2|nr:O-antigen ligase domain-containing protein [Bradyrhizobium aeschynomenes]NPV24152.1 O-antigen ligase domain-containing protein [Bradyrhizobium aeschynomenes]